MVAHHPILLAGSPLPGLSGVHLAEGRVEVASPTILRLLRQDFAPHLLAELASAEGRARLQGEVVTPPAPDAPLRLEQPVHRAFNLVLLEASCRTPGLPRLDPARIEGAGLVVRRRLGKGPVEGWMRLGGKVVGWRPLPAAALDPTSGWDPDPARRLERLRGVNGRLLARLPLPPDPLGAMEETVSGLFPVGPDLMKATGRTLLWGCLPVASAERAEEDEPPAPPFGRADIALRIPLLFRPDRDPSLLPPAGDVLGVASGRPPQLPDQGGMRTLYDALSYLAQEAGLFTGESYALPLAEVLRAIPVPDVPTRLADYHAYLEYAHAILFERRDPDAEAGIAELASHLMYGPSSWPLLDQASFDALVDAVVAALSARFARLAPAEGRFDTTGARYEIAAFVRVLEPGCPSRTIWSPASPPFTIKPWHESGDAPPVTVELPAPTRENLKKLKPNVAFKVPVELQEFMDRLNLQGLLDGKAEKRIGIKFGMICGFSIPIITLCAFIVLQIFLVLLHILFFWLPFVRICIPIPVPEVEEEQQ